MLCSSSSFSLLEYNLVTNTEIFLFSWMTLTQFIFGDFTQSGDGTYFLYQEKPSFVWWWLCVPLQQGCEVWNKQQGAEGSLPLHWWKSYCSPHLQYAFRSVHLLASPVLSGNSSGMFSVDSLQTPCIPWCALPALQDHIRLWSLISSSNKCWFLHPLSNPFLKLSL